VSPRESEESRRDSAISGRYWPLDGLYTLMSANDFHMLNGLSMLQLFRLEIETHSATLRQGLLCLENESSGTYGLEQLMRAAHSIKGAARIVNRSSAVRVAGSMEDCFVAARDNASPVPSQAIGLLLQGVDLLSCISKIPDDSIASWEGEHEAEIGAFLASLSPKGRSGKSVGRQGKDQSSDRSS
jgi:two-component system sensor histidine kinase and response regulator WspE